MRYFLIAALLCSCSTAQHFPEFRKSYKCVVKSDYIAISFKLFAPDLESASQAAENLRAGLINSKTLVGASSANCTLEEK